MGRFFSGLDPLKFGPRQFAQFSACREDTASIMPESAIANPKDEPPKFFLLTTHREFNKVFIGSVRPNSKQTCSTQAGFRDSSASRAPFGKPEKTCQSQPFW